MIIKNEIGIEQRGLWKHSNSDFEYTKTDRVLGILSDDIKFDDETNMLSITLVNVYLNDKFYCYSATFNLCLQYDVCLADVANNDNEYEDEVRERLKDILTTDLKTNHIVHLRFAYSNKYDKFLDDPNASFHMPYLTSDKCDIKLKSFRHYEISSNSASVIENSINIDELDHSTLVEYIEMVSDDIRSILEQYSLPIDYFPRYIANLLSYKTQEEYIDNGYLWALINYGLSDVLLRKMLRILCDVGTMLLVHDTTIANIFRYVTVIIFGYQGIHDSRSYISNYKDFIDNCGQYVLPVDRYNIHNHYNKTIGEYVSFAKDMLKCMHIKYIGGDNTPIEARRISHISSDRIHSWIGKLYLADCVQDYNNQYYGPTPISILDALDFNRHRYSEVKDEKIDNIDNDEK